MSIPSASSIDYFNTVRLVDYVCNETSKPSIIPRQFETRIDEDGGLSFGPFGAPARMFQVFLSSRAFGDV